MDAFPVEPEKHHSERAVQRLVEEAVRDLRIATIRRSCQAATGDGAYAVVTAEKHSLAKGQER